MFVIFHIFFSFTTSLSTFAAELYIFFFWQHPEKSLRQLSVGTVTRNGHKSNLSIWFNGIRL